MKYKKQIDALPRDDSAHEDQQNMMYLFVKAFRPKKVLEIGTHKGVTALYLAHALHDIGSGHLWTCDPYDYQQEETFAKFPELNKYITYEKKKGQDMDLEDIDFVFIDGFHEKHWVLAEIKHLLPRLTEGAIMFFHDAGGDNHMVGVNAAIKEAGLQIVHLKTKGVMALYSNYES